MSLRKQWRKLDRSIVPNAPDRYALYEVGDADGNTIGFGIGALPDELRELLAYGTGTEFHETAATDTVGEPTQIRWELANNKPHAEQLLAEQLDQ